MFFVVRCIIVWIVWLIFADKTRWRELFPVGFFASLLGAITDIMICSYPLWEYHAAGFDKHFIKLMDDLGIYIVVTYLFIQYLPRKRTYGNMFCYWFFWTGLAITIEWIHIVTGHMHHHLWWNLKWSYGADWFLFWLFYKYHQVFRFERLAH